MATRIFDSPLNLQVEIGYLLTLAATGSRCHWLSLPALYLVAPVFRVS